MAAATAAYFRVSLLMLILMSLPAASRFAMLPLFRYFFAA